MCDKYADKEEDQDDAGADPTVQHIWRGLVKKSLILLLDVSDRSRGQRAVAHREVREGGSWTHSLKLGGVDGNGRKGRRFGLGSIHGCWSSVSLGVYIFDAAIECCNSNRRLSWLRREEQPLGNGRKKMWLVLGMLPQSFAAVEGVRRAFAASFTGRRGAGAALFSLWLAIASKKALAGRPAPVLCRHVRCF